MRDTAKSLFTKHFYILFVYVIDINITLELVMNAPIETRQNLIEK